jgi:ribosomal protein S18 acetylase RimI-like enzyme
MNESNLALQSAEHALAGSRRTATTFAREDAVAIVLKRARQSDEEFMIAVYASSRADEMAITGWNLEQQDAFLRMQFDAQKRSYSAQFPQAEYSLIEFDGVAAGRLIVDRSGEEILLIDIAVLSQFRQKGIGSALLHQLMEEGGRTGKAIRLHVERFNPALHWYQRLGFKTASESAIYLEMVWTPGAADTGESRQAEPCI